MEPWQWASTTPRPLEQLKAYRALLSALEEQLADSDDWFAGALVWLYEAGDPAPGEKDAGFSPGGKPAERLLSKTWQRRLSGL